MSFSVPKLSATYRSVQPAIGTSGPSSRSILSASASDCGSTSVLLAISPSIDLGPNAVSESPGFRSRAGGSPSLLNRSIDRSIARAAAEVPRESASHLIQRRVAPERDRRHDHARRADAALRAAVFDEGVLQRMTSVKAFDGGDGRARRVRGRHETGVHGRAVNQDRTGAAFAFAAAFLRSREPAVLASTSSSRFIG